MARENYVAINRSLLHSEIWASEKPFTRGQAWVDLILLANWKRGFIYKREIKVVIDRGVVGRSQATLAQRWGWSRTKVKKFLNDLEEEQQIEQQKNNVTTLIKLVNYEKYQPESAADMTARSPQTLQQEARKADRNKKGNNGKKEKNVYLEVALDALPEQISADLAMEYIKHRKLMKKPLTQSAFQRAMKKAVKISTDLNITPERVIHTAVDSGWQGMETDWIANKLGIPVKSGKNFSEGADRGSRF